MNLLFNINDLKNLLVDYYNLTKMRIAIFDDGFHEIASYPDRLSTYCRIIRNDVAMHKKCTLCDYNAFIQCKQQKSLHIYACHAGLTEAIVPIFADQTIIGYIMLGQVLTTKDRHALWHEISESMKAHDVDLTALKIAFDNKRNVHQNVINSSAHMMKICASYLYSSHKLVLKKDSLPQKIDVFIGENLRNDLSVPLICNQFQIGKTKLYDIANQSYGMGIAKHITQIRLQRAKEYLMDTDLPIYEIADLVGIYDYNYFTKVFKKETGVTPKDFRKGNTLPV
ncbi:PocR ligand-binding domain-containing protein [Vallitalea pronyensis]|uniref:PocR ligand-binding domain-containing protein n=1 Tax=Vallitalea pronyensis TaxID=1348613 RepID=A0A8J8MPG5_9FIRM|nr:PocR ligand-binding domain-containing protein [Vallitalea pronyensis]QUI25321.1 PocR ligand-binding domain-containing protein [Vallitalea pronyensis]